MDSKALFKLGYGLYALTTANGDKDNVCIVNSVMQVTGDPLRLVVGVNKSNYSHELIVNSGKFNICTLTEDAPFGLFQDFGFRSGRDTDKWTGYVEKRSANGLRYLESYANAYLSCEVEKTVDMGTHSLFTVSVSDAEVLSDAESLTYAYYQKNIKPRPEAAEKPRWVCRICGYVHEGENLPEDFICPWCKHTAADFERK